MADELPRRVLPGLGTEVSALGAGCWAIGGPATNAGVPIGWDNANPEDAYAGLVQAHELGVTLFDTADVYGLGHSERLLGRLLRTTNRASMTVASKVGYFAGTARHGYEPAQMRHQFATTLDNLATDYLDIYYLHNPDFGPRDCYLAGAVEYVHQLRTQGLIKAVGMRRTAHLRRGMGRRGRAACGRIRPVPPSIPHHPAGRSDRTLQPA